MTKTLPRMMILIALVAATFCIALVLVHDSAAATSGRALQAMAERQAALDYRAARLQCDRASPRALAACIAAAHEEEGRNRAVAAAKHLSGARPQLHAAPELADATRR